MPASLRKHDNRPKDDKPLETDVYGTDATIVNASRSWDDQATVTIIREHDPEFADTRTLRIEFGGRRSDVDAPMVDYSLRPEQLRAAADALSRAVRQAEAAGIIPPPMTHGEYMAGLRAEFGSERGSNARAG